MKITYKPNWLIMVETSRNSPISPDYFQVRIVYKAPDSNTGEMTEVNFAKQFPSWELKNLNRIVEYCIQQAEDHEFKEWFKIDGVRVHDPHPELK